MIKKMMLAAILMQVSLVWSQDSSSNVCNGERNWHPGHWYYQEVWDHILPEDKPNSVIVITISAYFDSKLILRAKDKNRFELLRLEPSPNLFQSLDDLDKSCRLPADPMEAIKLLNIRWETTEISSSLFENLHRGLTAALTEYIADSQNRHKSILADGGVVILHGREYDITYDNDGYEHIQVEVNDGTDTSGKTFPLSGWVRATIIFSEDRFRAVGGPYVQEK